MSAILVKRRTGAVKVYLSGPNFSKLHDGRCHKALLTRCHDFYDYELMTITSLMDDYCPKRGFRGEHGLSLYLETVDIKLLLDAGQTDAFVSNAQALGIDLSSLDAVVLSHGHYDHGGGLKALYDRLSTLPPPLFAGRGFDAPRRAKNGDELKDIGLQSAFLPEHSPAPILIDTFEKMGTSAYILPPAEKIDGAEALPRFRVIQGGSDKLDNFDDELSLVFDEEDGIVVVTGCAHRGILNIAHAAVRAFPGKVIKALVGGFHLVDVSDEELVKIAKAIAFLEPKAVFCAHCTGPRGFSALLSILPGRVAWLSCGMSISI